MLYFARCENSGLWKIGCAANVVARVAQLVTARREPITIVAASPGSFAEETAMHRRFAHLRANEHVREWYADDGAIAAHVASLPEEWRAAATVIPWERKGGRPRLPKVPALWLAEAKREADARFLEKHNHRRSAYVFDESKCPACVEAKARRHALYERKSPLIFPKLYPRRPYATSQPSEVA